MHSSMKKTAFLDTEWDSIWTKSIRARMQGPPQSFTTHERAVFDQSTCWAFIMRSEKLPKLPLPFNIASWS